MRPCGAGTYTLVGEGTCTAPDGSAVNGRVRAALSAEADCASACDAQAACVGYSYYYAGSASSLGRCFVSGPGLQSGLVPMDPSNGPSAAEWQGYPQPSAVIAGANGSANRRCMRRGDVRPLGQPHRIASRTCLVRLICCSACKRHSLTEQRWEHQLADDTGADDTAYRLGRRVG